MFMRDAFNDTDDKMIFNYLCEWSHHLDFHSKYYK